MSPQRKWDPENNKPRSLHPSRGGIKDSPSGLNAVKRNNVSDVSLRSASLFHNSIGVSFSSILEQELLLSQHSNHVTATDARITAMVFLLAGSEELFFLFGGFTAEPTFFGGSFFEEFFGFLFRYCFGVNVFGDASILFAICNVRTVWTI